MKKILIMAGGTGGHVFPGLAVAKQLRDQGIEVHWLGTQKGLESRVIPEAGFPIHFISVGGLRGKGFKDLFFAPFRLTLALMQALRIIKQVNPDVVLGMGGFVSGPGGVASWLLRKPIVIHEQNATAGMTNTWLSCVAKKVLEGFPNTFKNRTKTITIGNPVRAEIVALPTPIQRFQNRKSHLHLLVLGGSLGAQAINELLPLALAQLPESERPAVLHQTGDKHLEKTKHAYASAGVHFIDAHEQSLPFFLDEKTQKANVELVPFIKDMSQAYAAADLVLCRAGALTVAELCAAGIGAILVPFPYAVDDHQTANANFMVSGGAAVLVQQRDLTVEKLTNLLKEFSISRDKCITMAEAAHALRHVDAAENVVLACKEVS